MTNFADDYFSFTGLRQGLESAIFGLRVQRSVDRD